MTKNWPRRTSLTSSLHSGEALTRKWPHRPSLQGLTRNHWTSWLRICSNSPKTSLLTKSLSQPTKLVSATGSKKKPWTGLPGKLSRSALWWPRAPACASRARMWRGAPSHKDMRSPGTKTQTRNWTFFIAWTLHPPWTRSRLWTRSSVSKRC